MLSSPPRSLARAIRLSTASERLFAESRSAISSGRDLFGKPVGAEQQQVSRREIDGIESDLDARLTSDGLQNHVAEGGLKGILLASGSGLNERLHKRLVPRDLSDLFVAQEVGPGVADVSQDRSALAEDHGR